MKKILYSFLVLSIMLPVMASAATFSFSPNIGSFTPGETFNVTVYVNPNAGEEITTAKLSVAFPADVLEVVSFSQNSEWMSLAQPGYDLVDNTAGKLIKTGGFPARVKETKQFGVLTLKAKNVGTGTLSTDGDSLLLDIANENKYVGSTDAEFTIAVAVTPEPETETSAPVETSETITTPISEEEESVEDVVATTSEDQTAAAAETGARTYWYFILLAAAILSGGVFAYRKWGSISEQ